MKSRLTYTKALLAVFKSRISDPRGQRGRQAEQGAVPSGCEDGVQTWYVDSIDYSGYTSELTELPGVTKTYRLTYESVEISHALFDKHNAPNGWKISSRILREYIEFFGTKTEQLDLLVKEEKAIFTSFTEKIMDGKGKGVLSYCETFY
jgi:cell cycle checkpoint control protein RAD9A